MKDFEYFDHTADTLFRAYGRTFEDALKNTIMAVYNVVVDTSTIKPLVSKKVFVSSKTKDSLVYDLINELLFLMDTEAFLAHSVDSIKLSDSGDGFSLSVVLKGDFALPGKYDVFSQIKSPTYNEMKIGFVNGNVFIQAVLDL